MENNFIKIKKFSLLFNYYAYLDSCQPYEIDNILDFYPELIIYFMPDMFANPDYPEFGIQCCATFKGRDSKRLEQQIFPKMHENLVNKFGEKYLEALQHVQNALDESQYKRL